ncbi:C1 family peptidase [Limosilactobacillus difficilis]|uniref:C1 family peptidase n=1 Tax=Limosilactobacillus difficilis TaxID=2991838 RepID=UPI0024B9E99F|nr:C1 family peptidase [Limosilactobacillus difficilis]
MTKYSALSQQEIKNFHDDFVSRETSAVIARAVMKNGIKASSENPAISTHDHRVFNVEVKTGAVTNQRQSGRCWSFAALNTLRHHFALKYKLNDFELSQNYLFFWDRIERANMFLQKVIATADKPFHDRTVDFLVSTALDDGGQWSNAAGIIEKYGVVPEYVMPDTYNTKNTSDVAAVMHDLMKKDALELRRQINEKHASKEQLAKLRSQMMSDVYRVAVMAFGEPPLKFDLEYKDDDKKYHRQADLTPLDFYHQYFDVDLRDYVLITNAPDHEMNKLYSMPVEDNVVDGIPLQFLNVPFHYLQDLAIKQLKDNETVWVGNDVLQQMDRKRGIMDSQLFKAGELLGVDFAMNKADRLESRQGMVSHAMTLTGVNLVDGEPNRWKIENSWGDKNGAKGYFVMTEDWFKDYTYEAVINQKYLDDDLKKLLTQKPVELPGWDSLA